MDSKIIYQGPREIPPTAENCNTTNHDQLSPFEFDLDARLIKVDSRWWDVELLPWARDIAAEMVEKDGFSVEKSLLVRRPGEEGPNKNITSFKHFWTFYNCHLHQYDAHFWLSEDSVAIDFSPRLARLLREVSLLWCSGFRPSSEHIEDITSHPIWKKSIRPILASQSRDWFVKLSTTSGKNDRAIVPIRTERELVDYLTTSKLLLKQYDSYIEAWDEVGDSVDPTTDPVSAWPASLRLFTLKLIFQPWNNNINSNCEFRVFIHRKRITAIAQQTWARKLSFPAPLELIVESIFELYYNRLIERLPYDSVALDVFFNAELQSAQLIECNPWGAWNAPGSSLFHWIHDFDIMYGNNGDQVVVRTWQEEESEVHSSSHTTISMK